MIRFPRAAKRALARSRSDTSAAVIRVNAARRVRLAATRLATTLLATIVLGAGLLVVTTGVASAAQKANTVLLYITDNTANWTVNSDNDGTPGGDSGEYLPYESSVTVFACSTTSGTGDQEITISDGGGAFATYNTVIAGSGCVTGYTFTANDTRFVDDWVASSGGNSTIASTTSNWTSLFGVDGYSGPSLGDGGSNIPFGGSASFCLPFSGGNVGSDNWSASAAPPGMTYNGNYCYFGTPSQAGSWSGGVTDTEYDGAGNPVSTTGYWSVTSNASPPYWTSAPGSGSAIDGEYDGDVASFSAASGDPSGVSYGESGLPSGLGLSGGTIYGTPSASPGNYDATISASNDGGTIYASITITIDQVPAITSAGSTTFAAGTSSSFSGSATGYPTDTITGSGALPAGVTFTDNGNNTFKFSGTPAAGSAGTWPVTVTASNGIGGGATQNFVLTVSPSAAFTGELAAVAGTGTSGVGASGASALTTDLGTDEEAITVDAAGDVFFADASNDTVDEIPHASGTHYGIPMIAGHAYVIAGDGTPGYSGDGTSAIDAELRDPRGVAIDAVGDVFISDTGNNRIREVPAVDTTSPDGTNLTADDIYTTAGNGTPGYYGDGGPANDSELDEPVGIAVDVAGDIFVADEGNNVIREIAVASGSAYGHSVTVGDISTVASVTNPVELAVDAAGNLYTTLSGANKVVMIPVASATHFGTAMTAGEVYVIGGNGIAGSDGNGDAATNAEFDDPIGLAVDGSGDVLVADAGNGGLREIAATSSTQWGLSMTAGDVYQLATGLSAPRGVAASASGAIYLADDAAEVQVLGLAPAITSADTASFSANLAGSFSATVTGTPTPTWSVSPPGGLPSGLTLSASGTLSGTPALGTAGTYVVTLYADNGVGSTASQNLTITVHPAATSLALSVTPSPPLVANDATVTVVVSPVPDAGTTVAITDAKGYFACSAAPVSAVTGLASCTSSTITSTASDLVSVTFNGDAQYATSTATLTLSPQLASTTVVLTAPGSAPSALSTTTLRATVSPVPDGGTVAFSDSAGYVSGCGSQPVNSSTGIATCTTGTLSAPGADTFSATYSGDADYLPSSTANLEATIGKAITDVVVTISPTNITADSQPSITATVTGPNGPVNGGTVSIGDTQGFATSAWCSNLTVSAGIASCQLQSITSLDPDTITASYAGDAVYAPSDAVAEMTPGQFPTSLSVSVSTNELAVGESSTITATLDQAPLSGTVGFSDTAGLISGCGAVHLIESATSSTASCTTASPTAAGSDEITVTYSGDTNDAGVTQVVAVPIDTEPSISSATSFTTATGDAFSATLTTSGSPSVSSITDDGGSLPSGLALHDNGNGTATISGTVGPTAGGVATVVLGLDDGVLSPVTDDLTFTVDQPAAFTTSSTGTCVAGSACDISVTTSGYPLPALGVSAALPSGLSFVPHGNGTADITGTASAGAVGTTNFTITATSSVGDATQQFTLTVSPLPSPGTTTIITTTPGGSTTPNTGNSAPGGAAKSTAVTTYLMTAKLSGALAKKLSCTAPASAVEEQAKSSTLDGLGFTLTCGSTRTKASLVGSIAKRTVTVMEKTKSGARVPLREKDKAGKVVDVTRSVWLGSIRLSDPSLRLVVTLRTTSVRMNRQLVITGMSAGVPTSGPDARHTVSVRWVLTPRVSA